MQGDTHIMRDSSDVWSSGLLKCFVLLLVFIYPSLCLSVSHSIQKPRSLWSALTGCVELSVSCIRTEMGKKAVPHAAPSSWNQLQQYWERTPSWSRGLLKAWNRTQLAAAYALDFFVLHFYLQMFYVPLFVTVEPFFTLGCAAPLVRAPYKKGSFSMCFDVISRYEQRFTTNT